VKHAPEVVGIVLIVLIAGAVLLDIPVVMMREPMRIVSAVAIDVVSSKMMAMMRRIGWLRLVTKW